MFQRICIILCLILAGCTIQNEENKGAALIPYQIKYEKPFPVMLENISYSQKNSSFNSVLNTSFDSIEMAISDELKKQVMDIWDWNDVSRQIVFTTYGMPFYEGQSYRMSMDVSSTIADTVTVIFDDYTDVFYEKSFSISEETRKIQIDYTHSGLNLDDCEIKILFSKQNQLLSGQIILEDLSMVRTNGIDYGVKINQVGYLPQSQKLAVFRYNSGDWFDVINTQTNEVVYTGRIVGRTDNTDTGEINYYGDFSSVNQEGSYRIESQFGGQSYEFVIKENLYEELLKDSLKMITIQRCGTSLSKEIAGDFSHDFCHNTMAKAYSLWEDFDVSGGWHDAGDYGRYTLTAVKTMNDLMLAYYVYPESFTDCMNLPESGNGIPDILDEAKVGLDWLKKMQAPWGSVYTAAVTTQFADFVTPDQDEQQMWILDEENTSTAAAAGAFAMGAIVFESWDNQAAQQYLDCAIRAYDNALNSRMTKDKRNPEEISAGDYANSSDDDEIYFASAMLYAATHDEKYLDQIKESVNSKQGLTGLSYSDFGGYGSYYLLKDEQFQKTRIYPDLYNYMMEYSMNLVWDNVNDGYHLTIESYHWGANMDVSNNAMMMLLLNDVQPSADLIDAAFEQLCYLLGKNSLNMSFVTGYGTVYPKAIHHRPAIVHQVQMSGALVGGPDGSLDSNLPPAKKYWDDSQSFTTNEVAIYYNSPLVFVLSAFKK
ncbi:MAG: glycoside hydrolase family 9 protein [Erysipelotrichaceae bacterium]|nr:glycoside hydrolase family 9 protein [Erysipelotrichaceae bacterium]